MAQTLEKGLTSFYQNFLYVFTYKSEKIVHQIQTGEFFILVCSRSYQKICKKLEAV